MCDVSKTLNRNQFQSCRIETVPLVVSSYKRPWRRKISEITCFGPGIKHVIGHPQQIPAHVLIIELLEVIQV